MTKHKINSNQNQNRPPPEGDAHAIYESPFRSGEGFFFFRSSVTKRKATRARADRMALRNKYI
jgi:hypothetical protein